MLFTQILKNLLKALSHKQCQVEAVLKKDAFQFGDGEIAHVRSQVKNRVESSLTQRVR